MNDPRKVSVDTRFKPGNKFAAGNRGKAKPITDQLVDILSTRPDLARALAMKIILKATEESAYLRELLQRVEGRVPMFVTQELPQIIVQVQGQTTQPEIEVPSLEVEVERVGSMDALADLQSELDDMGVDTGLE